jgi:hypothetical protein
LAGSALSSGKELTGKKWQARNLQLRNPSWPMSILAQFWAYQKPSISPAQTAVGRLRWILP